uniref:tRNA-synt_1g domain-containing protein n=1 Tax=Wuchereria bancrofti TaxID=6293 RepID=A0A1I8EXD6_WUCBA
MLNFHKFAAPHIGHLYTALLADVSNRWKLLKSGDVNLNNSLFTTGTDEHDLKTATTADCDRQCYCDDISDKFKDLFRAFGIQPNDFIRTTETRHKEVVGHKELDKRGLIQRGKHEGWYSTVDECFYANDEVEKLDGQTSTVSKITGSVVGWQEENYVFPLLKYLGAVRNWLSNASLRANLYFSDVIRPKVYFPQALQQASVERGLSLSRDRKRVTWGIVVPVDESQTVRCISELLTVSGVFSNKKRFHAVIWPAFLLALELPLPKRIFVHIKFLSSICSNRKILSHVLLTVNVIFLFICQKVLEMWLIHLLLLNHYPKKISHLVLLSNVSVSH